jgi:hypothetical protein
LSVGRFSETSAKAEADAFVSPRRAATWIRKFQKNLRKKFSLNPPKYRKFGTNHVFVATWPMESIDHAAEIKGHNIFDGAMMPNQPRRRTVASKRVPRDNKIWWDSVALKTFSCFFRSSALTKIFEIPRLEQSYRNLIVTQWGHRFTQPDSA